MTTDMSVRPAQLTEAPILLGQLSSYSEARSDAKAIVGDGADYGGIVVPLTLATSVGSLSFLSTTTIFGTPLDVTLSELAIESFFPADAATADALRHLSSLPK